MLTKHTSLKLTTYHGEATALYMVLQFSVFKEGNYFPSYERERGTFYTLLSCIPAGPATVEGCTPTPVVLYTTICNSYCFANR